MLPGRKIRLTKQQKLRLRRTGLKLILRAGDFRANPKRELSLWKAAASVLILASIGNESIHASTYRNVKAAARLAVQAAETPKLVDKRNARNKTRRVRKMNANKR